MSDVLSSKSDPQYFSLSSSSDSFLSAVSDFSDEPSLAENLLETFSSLHKNFNIVHIINAQSIATHYADLLATFSNKNIHAVLISETFLKPSLSSHLYPLPGFRLIRHDRTCVKKTDVKSRQVG